MAAGKSEILQGTLDLMVLKTLGAMGPLHDYGIARRIEQISEEALRVRSHRCGSPCGFRPGAPRHARGSDRRPPQ
jgi:hypothetical protein